MKLGRELLRSTLVVVALAALMLLHACTRPERISGPTATRSFAMGCSWFPPRPDLGLALQVADLSAQYSDHALILVGVPWDSLLDGRPAERLVRGNELGLAEYYRAKGLDVVVSIDPTNGFDRASEAPALSARHRSLADPAVQTLYRSYALAIATLLRPEYLGLASETNLVRGIAPDSLYQGLRIAANGAAGDVRVAVPSTKLFVTVQVEFAWGRPSQSFVGVAADRADFPFLNALGLSSFPYLGGWADPDSLPLDYFSRLVDGAPLPVLQIEGGWPSDEGSGVLSSPEMQRRYVRRVALLLDEARAVGWFQINFTDLEEGQWPAGARQFARIGLVDAALQAKPALEEWRSVFARRLR
ncbi:MAG: hypothetical protein U0527_12205 [Candidatus Eisenbacteria bacterium]